MPLFFGKPAPQEHRSLPPVGRLRPPSDPGLGAGAGFGDGSAKYCGGDAESLRSLNKVP